MADDPNKSILDYLGWHFRRINLRFDKMEADMAEIKQRLTVIEVQGHASSPIEVSHYEKTTESFNRLTTDIDMIKRSFGYTSPHNSR